MAEKMKCFSIPNKQKLMIKLKHKIRKGICGYTGSSPSGVRGMVGAGTGGCFMMMGRAEGRFWPCNFILISFMAIENSKRSIFPSLFISARALQQGHKVHHQNLTGKELLSETTNSYSLPVSYQAIYNTKVGKQLWGFVCGGKMCVVKFL